MVSTRKRSLKKHQVETRLARAEVIRPIELNVSHVNILVMGRTAIRCRGPRVCVCVFTVQVE